MTQPTRWLDDRSTSAEIRELLRAGARPPRFPKVALAATVIPLAQKAALANTATLSATTLAAIKATTIGLAIGLGSIAAVKTLSRPNSPATEAMPRLEQPGVNTVLSSRGVATAAELAQPEINAPVPERAPTTPVVTAATVASAPTGIAAEAQLLERARSLLDESPERALMLTNEHRERFIQGQLSAERELIAIDALLRLGRHQQAAERARPFLTDGSSQLFTQRVRNLLSSHSR
jgi:hypothetical protein